MSKHGYNFLEMFDKIDVLNISKSSKEISPSGALL